MLGVFTKHLTCAVADDARSPEAVAHRRDARSSLRWLTVAATIIPLSLLLSQCGRAPSPTTLAANASAASGDSFDDRFPKPEFRDRFPSANESFQQRQMTDFTPRRTVQTQTYRVASIDPSLTLPKQQQQVQKDELTTLVSMKSSAFPYYGNNPASEAPFLNVGGSDPRAIAAIPAASTGRTRPTTTTACWCTSPRISTRRSPA